MSFLCPSGAGLGYTYSFPRVALRFTRGYRPWPRWGRSAGVGCEALTRETQVTSE